MKKRYAIPLGVAACLLCFAALDGMSVVLARRLTHARTAEEVTVLCTYIQRFRSGYSVDCYDGKGHECFPARTGDYESVRRMYVTFNSGISAGFDVPTGSKIRILFME